MPHAVFKPNPCTTLLSSAPRCLDSSTIPFAPRPNPFLHIRHHGLVLSRPLLDHVLNERFPSLVRTPNQRSTSAVQETHVERSLPPHLKYFRGDVFVHFHVSFGGLHVLPKGYDIDVGGAKI